MVWLWVLAAVALAQPPWQKLESREGKFVVQMPGVARSSVVPLQTAAGSLQQHQYLVNLGSRAFMVTYLDYPSSTVESLGPGAIVSNACESVKQNGGTILEETELDISDTVGRDLFYRKDSSFWIHSRLLLVGTRFYQLTLVHDGQGPDPDARRFFDSFRFTP